MRQIPILALLTLVLSGCYGIQFGESHTTTSIDPSSPDAASAGARTPDGAGGTSSPILAGVRKTVPPIPNVPARGEPATVMQAFIGASGQ